MHSTKANKQRARNLAKATRKVVTLANTYTATFGQCPKLNAALAALGVK